MRDVPDKELKRALIDRELLDYRRYRTFLRTRAEKIINALEKRIGLTDKDFEFLHDPDVDEG